MIARIRRGATGDRAEFGLITFWESEDAIRRDRFLVARDDRVRHFEMVHHDLAT